MEIKMEMEKIEIEIIGTLPIPIKEEEVIQKKNTNGNTNGNDDDMASSNCCLFIMDNCIKSMAWVDYQCHHNCCDCSMNVWECLNTYCCNECWCNCDCDND